MYNGWLLGYDLISLIMPWPFSQGLCDYGQIPCNLPTNWSIARVTKQLFHTAVLLNRPAWSELLAA